MKWSAKGQEANPVSWLDEVVRREQDNMKRLAEEGARNYDLITNVASTGQPKTGTFDRLSDKLDEHAKRLGFETMSCLDNAQLETKWAYAEMLAGWDLVRYLVAEQVGTQRDEGLRAGPQVASAGGQVQAERCGP